jgi:inner membrane protein
MGRTHAISGAVAWLALSPHLTHDWGHAALGVPIAALAALGPDIDHGQSTVSHRLWGPFHSFIGTRVGRLLGGHRQGAHSLLSIVAVFILAGLSAPWVGGLWVAFAITVGWVAHIAGDLLTDRGVGILWPFTRRRFRLLTISTGGFAEGFVRFTLTVIGLWIVAGPSLQPFLS